MHTSVALDTELRGGRCLSYVGREGAELAKHAFRPLYSLAVAGEEVLVNGAWTTSDADRAGKRRVTYAYGNVRVIVTDPQNDDTAVRFESLAVLVDGTEVARRRGADLPDRTGCSARRMKLEGVNPESRALEISYTNGFTTHNCDEKPEPQVHHVIRW